MLPTERLLRRALSGRRDAPGWFAERFWSWTSVEAAPLSFPLLSCDWNCERSCWSCVSFVPWESVPSVGAELGGADGRDLGELPRVRVVRGVGGDGEGSDAGERARGPPRAKGLAAGAQDLRAGCGWQRSRLRPPIHITLKDYPSIHPSPRGRRLASRAPVRGRPGGLRCPRAPGRA